MWVCEVCGEKNYFMGLLVRLNAIIGAYMRNFVSCVVCLPIHVLWLSVLGKQLRGLDLIDR